MTSFVEFINALPAFIQLLNRLCGILIRFMNVTQTREFDEWINSLEASVDQLEKAQTAQQKLAAATSLDGVIRNLK